MPFPPFARISPATGVAVDRITLPHHLIGNIGPKITFVGGARSATYVCLVNGPAAANNGIWPVGGGAPATRSLVHMMKSTDGGNTWAEVGAGDPNQPEVPPKNGGDVTNTDGWMSAQGELDSASGIIYVAHFIWDYVNYASASPYEIALARFDTGSVSGSEGWLAPLTTYGEANAPTAQLVQSAWGQFQPFGFKRRGSDGHFLVFYVRTELIAGSPRFHHLYDRTYLSEYIIGSGWQATQLFAGAALEVADYDPYGAVLGLNNRTHCFMFQYNPPDGLALTDYRIYSRSVDSAGAFDTLALVADTNPNQDNAGRQAAVTTPQVRSAGGNIEILLGLIIQPGAVGNTLYLTYRGNSAANLTAASFTQELVDTNVASTFQFFWGAASLCSAGFGAINTGEWYNVSWGANEFFYLWQNLSAGAGWTARTQLFDDGTFLNSALNVGMASGIVGVMTGLGPTGFVLFDEVFYWEFGAVVAPAVGGGGTGGAGGGGSARMMICGPGNAYDECLRSLYRRFEERLIACPVRCEPPPFIDAPGFANRFQRVQAIPLPADDGTDNAVITWRVPPGWNGMLVAHAHQFTGAGFREGSGDLTWRVQRDYGYFRDLGAMTESIGDPSVPYQLEGAGYRIHSNQTLTYVVNVAVGAAAVLDPNGLIVCFLAGWIYPVHAREAFTPDPAPFLSQRRVRLGRPRRRYA